MSRPTPGLASVGETLHRVLSGERPEWISADTWHALRVALRRLRRDAVRSLERVGPAATSAALDVGRSTVARWREPGGWLAQSRDGDEA